jgi:hypothetical protein
MKKLQLILICLLYSAQAISQRSNPDKIMQLTLPKGTERLSKQQYNEFSKQFTKTFVGGYHTNLYKKDGLLIYYLNLSVPAKMKKNLESDQRMIVSLLGQLKGTVVDTSKIISINNNQFLIINFHEKDDWYIRFTSDYDRNNKSINGFIEYKKPDEEEAKQYLQVLLKNMHFKNPS